MKIATILLSLGALATSVTADSPAYAALAVEEYNVFDEHDRAVVTDLVQEVQSSEQSPEHRNLLLGIRNAKPGGFCVTSNACPDDFTCTSGRCIPSPDSCIGKAIADHVAVFDSDAWVAEAMKEAGVTKESLLTAGRGFRDIQGIQGSRPFQKLAAALQARPAPEILQLKESVDSCMDEKQSYCTIFYQGINFEISGLADIAAAVLWAYGLNGPVGFVRGSFGLEIGIPGGDMSYTFGFAFTCDPGDIATGGIVVDVDAGVGPNVGFATIAGLNGANAIEITMGAGFGLGIVGVGYSITATLNPTQAPTLSPTPGPTPKPPTGGGGGGGPANIADFGCGCTADADCATAGSTCADGSSDNGGEHDTDAANDVPGTASCSGATPAHSYCKPSVPTGPGECGCQVHDDCEPFECDRNAATIVACGEVGGRCDTP